MTHSTNNPTNPSGFPSEPSDATLRCDQAREHLHLYVERELDSIRTRLVESHLSVCSECRQQIAELEDERLWLMSEFLERPPLSDRFAAKVVERIESARENRVRRHVHHVSLWVAAACLLFALGATWMLVGQHGAENPEVDRVVAKDVLGTTNGHQNIDIVEDQGVGQPAEPPATLGQDTILAVTTPDSDLRHLLWVNRMGKIVDTVSSPYLVPEEPCGPDLNNDGRTDGNDVTYTCMVHFSRPPPSVLASEDNTESDCPDNLCL